MCTERAIVVESVYDEFELIIRGKGKELAAALADSTKTAVGEMEVAGEGPARKVRGLVEDALAKVSCSLSLSSSLERVLMFCVSFHSGSHELDG